MPLDTSGFAAATAAWSVQETLEIVEPGVVPIGGTYKPPMVVVYALPSYAVSVLSLNCKIPPVVVVLVTDVAVGESSAPGPNATPPAPELSVLVT